MTAGHDPEHHCRDAEDDERHDDREADRQEGQRPRAEQTEEATPGLDHAEAVSMHERDDEGSGEESRVGEGDEEKPDDGPREHRQRRDLQRVPPQEDAEADRGGDDRHRDGDQQADAQEEGETEQKEGVALAAESVPQGSTIRALPWTTSSRKTNLARELTHSSAITKIKRRVKPTSTKASTTPPATNRSHADSMLLTGSAPVPPGGTARTAPAPEVGGQGGEELGESEHEPGLRVEGTPQQLRCAAPRAGERFGEGDGGGRHLQ